MAKWDSVRMLAAKIKLLNGVRNDIALGLQTHICTAIRTRKIGASLDHWLAGEELRAYIVGAMGVDTVYFEDWLIRALPAKQFENRPSQERAQIAREARVQWLDWMIAELKDQLRERAPRHRALNEA